MAKKKTLTNLFDTINRIDRDFGIERNLKVIVSPETLLHMQAEELHWASVKRASSGFVAFELFTPAGRMGVSAASFVKNGRALLIDDDSVLWYTIDIDAGWYRCEPCSKASFVPKKLPSAFEARRKTAYWNF